MASTVLPNGIIIPEKYSRDWYNDLYHNWQELDNLLGGGTPKDGTLTIQKNGTTVGTFSANQATDETINITVPDVNNGTLTIQQNGTTVDTFTANSSSDKTVNIQCVDLSSAQTVAGNKTFSGNTKFAASTTIEKSGGDVELLIKNTAVDATSVSANTLDDIRFVDSNDRITGAMRISYNTSNDVTAMLYARSYSADGSVSSTNGISITSNQQTGAARANISANLLPNSTNTYDLGSSATQWNNAYIKTLTVNGTAAGDILTHNASEFVPRSGGAVLTGQSFSRNVNDSTLVFRGGTNARENGAQLELCGKDSSESGCVIMQANNGAKSATLKLTPDGALTVENAPIVSKVNFTRGTIPSSTLYTATRLYRDNINYPVFITQNIINTSGENFTQFLAYPANSSSNTFSGFEFFYGSTSTNLAFRPTNDNVTTCGSSGNRWETVYSATGTINTSDSRLKNSIKDIDDKLLDVWGNIEPKQYKFNDATEKKGDKARYHTGYLAQDIQAECEKQGINASDYGLFCYDEWEEQEEVSEEIETEKGGKKVKEKHVIQPKKEKGNIYALRYEEALVVECKYLRRCISRLVARIEQLEKGNK